jgi:RNA 3'-terminal phosphate cyclase (ATP)
LCKCDVGQYLAKQLLLLFALAGGGAFTTLPLTSHSITNREIIELFLEVRITARELQSEAWLVEVQPK